MLSRRRGDGREKRLWIENAEDVVGEPPMPSAGSLPDFADDALGRECPKQIRRTGLTDTQLFLYRPNGHDGIGKQQIGHLDGPAPATLQR